VGRTDSEDNRYDYNVELLLVFHPDGVVVMVAERIEQTSLRRVVMVLQLRRLGWLQQGH